MLKRTVKTIHDLKIFFLALIMISFFYYLGVNPVDIGRFLGAKIGSATGVTSTASVPANPFNTLALQLREKEQDLSAREQALNEREKELTGSSSQKILMTFLTIGIFILFFLIILNYYLDYKRRIRAEKDEKKI